MRAARTVDVNKVRSCAPMEPPITIPAAGRGEHSRAPVPCATDAPPRRLASPLWSRQDVVAHTGGRPIAGPDDDWQADDVSYRPDEVHHGALVLVTHPLTWGRRLPDTSALVAELARAGAAAIITQTITPTITPTLTPNGAAISCPLLEVRDTRRALDALARAARARFAGRVVCIVGDRMRRPTKELLRDLLEAQAPTFASAAGYRGPRGIALSLARTPPCRAYAVYDVSTERGPATRAAADLARPHVAVVTDVRRAGSRSATDAMGAVFDGLEPGGIVVVNHDLPHRDRLLLAAVERGATRAVTFGASPGADVRLVATRRRAGGVSEVRAEVVGVAVTFPLPSDGRRLVMSALAAIAAAHALGADWRRAHPTQAGVASNS